MKCNAILLSSILRNCVPDSAIYPAKQSHAQMLIGGLLPDVTLQTDLVMVYSKCGLLNDAQQVFEQMVKRSMHSWNILISSYVQSSLYLKALGIFRGFLKDGLRPDHFTFPPVFKACAAIGDCCLGKMLHSSVIRLGFEDHLVVGSSILVFYAKCDNIIHAQNLFANMGRRDVVVWNSMISGFGRAGFSAEALVYFRNMLCEGVKMDSRTIPSVLSVCGSEGHLTRGKEIHAQVLKSLVFSGDVVIGNSLIDMYSKCGCLDYSRKVFFNMSDPNLVTWTTVISCYGVHGKGVVSLILFEKMRVFGFKPNCVTFTAVLASCSHSGLIKQGQKVFDSMSLEYGVEPTVEHYACMVDLLSRFGHLEEALSMIKMMPVEPSASVWGALLAGCRMHNNVKIGEIAACKLFELETRNASNYIALCNIYICVGQGDGVSKIRSRMRELGLVKTPGYSSITIGGMVDRFYQGDISHPWTEMIYGTLDVIVKRMMLPEGYRWSEYIYEA